MRYEVGRAYIEHHIPKRFVLFSFALVIYVIYEQPVSIPKGLETPIQISVNEF